MKTRVIKKLFLKQVNRQIDKPDNRLTKLGQTVLEYALLLAIVSAAFITMSVYVRRAIQGRLYMIDQRVAAKDVKSPAALPPPPPCWSWPIC